MTIRPHNFTNYDDFSAAVTDDAVKLLPVVTNYDSHADARDKRAAIYVAAVSAEEDAREAWEAHVEHMEELYERGVGPAWEGNY